jgi:phenylalanyl-tRNA synthetase beta chain
MLSSQGFNEIMNNSLTRSKYAEERAWLDTANSVFLLNPLSQDLNVMRQTMLFGGLETIAWNQNRKTSDLKLYEFGRTYLLDPGQKNAGKSLARYDEHEHLALWITGKRQPESWRTNDLKIDFFDLKAFVHGIFTRLGFNPDKIGKSYFTDDLFDEGTAYSCSQVTLVRFGWLKKKELKRFDLKQDVIYADFDWEKVIGLLSENVVTYREVAKFPEVRRDLALVLDSSVKYEEVEKAAYQAEKHILKGVSLFDVYQGDKIGPGKKSYAISFLLRDDEKTLTDQIIEQTMDKILRAFQEKFHASIR